MKNNIFTKMPRLGLMVLLGTAPRLLPAETTQRMMRTHTKKCYGILALNMFKTFVSLYGNLLSGTTSQLLGG